MNYSIYLNIVLISMIIIILIGFRKIYVKKINFHESYKKILQDSTRELTKNNKELEKQQKIIELSNKNLASALLCIPLKDGKRHLDVCEINDGQQIVVMFDEKWTYSIEYFDKKPLSDKEPYIKVRELRCTVFIDGETFDPILLNPICKQNKKAVIDPIDCYKYKGRGVGTSVIQSLVKILKGLNIEELRASLSTIDYHNRDKLYNFYINKNGFELIHELTEDSWGLVVKKIK
jgi:hypothetical protein